MNKVFYAVALVVITLLMASCTTPKDQVIIKGEIRELDNEKIYLKVIGGDRKWTDIDSAVVSNGIFSLKAEIKEAQVAYLVSEKKTIPAIFFFIEPGEINVTNNTSDGSLLITGSFSQSELDTLDANIQLLNDKARLLAKEYSEAIEANDTLHAANLKTELEFNRIDLANSKEMFLKEHPKSPVSLYLIMSDMVFDADVETMERYQSYLAPSLLSTAEGKVFLDRIAIMKKVAPGQPAPEISLPDSLDVVKKLSDMRGKYVLVDFWASWCRPCREENPRVVATYQEYHDKGLEILGVSIDNNRARWIQAIHEDKLDWHHVIDVKGWESEAAKAYGVFGIPANFLIDPDGTIIASGLMGDDLKNKLAELL